MMAKGVALALLTLRLNCVAAWLAQPFSSSGATRSFSSRLCSEAADENKENEPTKSFFAQNATSEMEESNEPPPTFASDSVGVNGAEEPAVVPNPAFSVDEGLFFLQSLGAITSRGEQATEQQVDAARSVVSQLEAANPTPEPMYAAADMLQGTWELTFTDTRQLFRSSPFFMAGRAVCTTPEQAQQYNWFCTMHRQALAISNIGPVRQVITPTQLISEFEVQAGAVPFLNDLTPFSYSGGMPLTITGAIVSTADWKTVNATALELFMDTVQIKGSNIPGLRQLLDNGNVQLQSRQLGNFLEANVASYSNPRPIVRTTYLSEQVRILRDMDDNLFVYVKTSDSVEPKDYSGIDADLGVTRLLEGFNDAVTRFYL